MPKQVRLPPKKFSSMFTLLCAYQKHHVNYKAILKPGDQLKGYRVTEVRVFTEGCSLQSLFLMPCFILKQTRTVPELQLTAIQLQHEKTGAKHLHVDRDDSNNVFAVGFSTPVSDSTGVPHILVHSSM
jgi:hypothetical protein